LLLSTTVQLNKCGILPVNTMKVFVYYNLRKKCFSVKALEGADKGRVVKHASSVILTNVTFKVSEAGRQRVLRDKQKNVHAGAQGTLCSTDIPFAWVTARPRSATYNPYDNKTFIDVETKQPVLSSDMVELTNRKVFYKG